MSGLPVYGLSAYIIVFYYLGQNLSRGRHLQTIGLMEYQWQS